MRPPFAMIAQAMMGPRGSGRTYRMIASAPQGATLLAHDAQHEEFLLRQARDQGRQDLKAHTPREHSLAGQRGEFIPDHFAVEGWLMDAEAEIQKRIDEGRELAKRLARAESELELLRKSSAA